ncbi:hypothetical protein [Streptosporangium sp. NPDC002524]|uniref:hypothetical protein n=1 Tax=Streptosporangium sp. NPDC002524 TaxID=3154537 RepID=UPI003333C443
MLIAVGMAAFTGVIAYALLTIPFDTALRYADMVASVIGATVGLSAFLVAESRHRRKARVDSAASPPPASLIQENRPENGTVYAVQHGSLNIHGPLPSKRKSLDDQTGP